MGQGGSCNVVGTGAIAGDGHERDVCQGVAVAIQSDPFFGIAHQNGIPQVGVLVKRIGVVNAVVGLAKAVKGECLVLFGFVRGHDTDLYHIGLIAFQMLYEIAALILGIPIVYDLGF